MYLKHDHDRSLDQDQPVEKDKNRGRWVNGEGEEVVREAGSRRESVGAGSLGAEKP